MSNKANINRRQSIKAMVAGTASVAGLSSSVLSQTLHHVERNPNKIKLKFGVINDVHHTTTKHNLEPDIGEHSEWIKAFAEAMNAANASFVVSNGDQVHEGYNGSIPSRYKETEFIRNLETYKENMGFFKGPSCYPVHMALSRGQPIHSRQLFSVRLSRAKIAIHCSRFSMRTRWN